VAPALSPDVTLEHLVTLSAGSVLPNGVTFVVDEGVIVFKVYADTN